MCPPPWLMENMPTLLRPSLLLGTAFYRTAIPVSNLMSKLIGRYTRLHNDRT